MPLKHFMQDAHFLCSQKMKVVFYDYGAILKT